MTHSEDLEAFIAANPWSIDACLVEVGILRHMAALIDGGTDTPAMLAQYGLWFRDLKKQSPDGAEDVDPLEALLKR